MVVEYFGVRLIKKRKSFNLKREEFAVINTKPSLPFFHSLAERNAYADKCGTQYNKEWCQEYRELCLKNYDLNMKYFSMLNKEEFNDSLNSFLNKYKEIKEVTNLNECAEVEGYYIMVLDEYNQVYIGQSDDIKKRIMRHWSTTKAFDRTLFPMYAYDSSVFSIDFFRAFDTTRIYVWERKIVDGVEADLINNFPSKFAVNRIGGNVTNLIQALETMKKRDFSVMDTEEN